MIKSFCKLSVTISVIALLLFSCVSGEKITYYQNMEMMEQEATLAQKGLEIKPLDLLTISVAAENMESVQPFNLLTFGRPLTPDAVGLGVGATQNQQQPYLVDNQGNINFPLLGKVNVAGLTRQELSDFLKVKISAYVQNPHIYVRILNFQITVLGEVNQPGTFSISDEFLTLNQALGLAGDLTIYGKRNNVLVLREGENGKTYKYLDLTDSSILNSPFYYLEQNDVIYVEPNNAQKQGASYNRNSSVYISIVSVVISLVILFTN